MSSGTESILIFDLEVTGHHAGYIRHLLHYWPHADDELVLVVSPQFLAQHQDVVATQCRANVTWVSITQEELAWYEASKCSLLRYTWAEWRLFCRYAQKVNAAQGLVMYVDRFQLPLALRLPLPCPLSGIYFRPKFHYRAFASHRPAQGEEARAKREKWLWRSALGHPQLKTLFCLDPFAVEPMNRLSGRAKVVHLPDPVEIYPQPAKAASALRHELGIEPERKIFLLFGVLDRRKGIYQVLEAVKGLPVKQQSQVALLLVGTLANADMASVLAQIEEVGNESKIQIALCDYFVKGEDIQSYFEMADVVLALYQQHVGSSGILLWAAAAGKPVLASDYGLMGELVRQYELGVALDSTKVHTVMLGIEAFLKGELSEKFDIGSARTWAKKNSAEHFAETIILQTLESSVNC